MRTSNGNAVYRVGLDEGMVELVEQAFAEERIGECIGNNSSVTLFVVDAIEVLGEEQMPIGASKGQETNLVLVKLDKSWNYHGCPITPDEVETKKRKYNRHANP